MAAGVIEDELFEDRSRAESFGAVADLYDRVRPSYPSALLEALVGDGARDVLDVGCGTGKAGALLFERGCSVLGVEVDARMAEVARFKGLEVQVARFELWDPGPRRFDLVISGQAWHWIDPLAGAAKAAVALREGGRICLFWNWGDPPGHVRERLVPIYDRLAPEGESETSALERRARVVRETVAGIDRSGEFGPAEVSAFPWSRSYTTEQWLEARRTHSGHLGLEPQRRERLLEAVGAVIEALGGSFEVQYETVLVSAARVARTLA